MERFLILSLTFVSALLLCLMSRMTLIYWLSQCLQRNQLENFPQEIKQWLRTMGLSQVCGVWQREALSRMHEAENNVFLVASFPKGLFLPTGLGGSQVLWNLTPFVNLWSCLAQPAVLRRVLCSPRPPRNGTSLLSVLSVF